MPESFARLCRRRASCRSTSRRRVGCPALLRSSWLPTSRTTASSCAPAAGSESWPSRCRSSRRIASDTRVNRSRLVAAETQQIADHAAELVEIQYDELAGVFDPLQAMEAQSPLVHDEGNVLVNWHIARGDAELGLARADVVVEGEYVTQHVEHAYLEPETGVAWIEDDVVTIRASTQVIEHSVEIARILGLPSNKVRVIAAYMGGGFGGKEDMTVEPYLALLTWSTRRPVRMIWDRQESLAASTQTAPDDHALQDGGDERRTSHRSAGRDHRRRRRVPISQPTDRLRCCGGGVRSLQRRRRRCAITRCLHEQRADERLPWIRGDAGHVRLRVADGSARRSASHRSGRAASPELPVEGRRHTDR